MQIVKQVLSFPRDGLLENEPKFDLTYQGKPIEKFLDTMKEGNCCLAIVDKYHFIYLKKKKVFLADKIVTLKDRSVFSYFSRRSFKNLGEYLWHYQIKAEIVMNRSVPKLLTFEMD